MKGNLCDFFQFNSLLLEWSSVIIGPAVPKSLATLVFKARILSNRTSDTLCKCTALILVDLN